MPPKKSSGDSPPSRVPAYTKKSRPELIRLWEKLDSQSRGYVTVHEILKQSKLVESECPEFIREFEQVAKDGRVSRADFLEFCLGRRVSSASKDSSETHAVDMKQLKDMFNFVAGPGGEIRLADLIKHKARIKEVFPPLLEKFGEIDLDNNSTVTWAELEVFAGGTGEWLEYQLDRVIGLELLKQQIRQFHKSVILDKQRRKAGHDIKTGGKYHMIFQGNPGTGKTSLARIVAQLLHRIGIVQTDLLVEVQRDKLVAEYVGQTGPKTQKVIEEAKKGVLFIDEAYRLSQEGGKSDFGREAIEQLMAAMNDPPGRAPIMVFAGYADDMDTFMQANSGLYRRIAYTFDFSDYSTQELAELLNSVVKGAGFRLSADLASDNFRRLAALIQTHTLPQAREMMNGGICERIFDFAKQSLDSREAARTPKDVPSLELLQADIVDACKRIPLPPCRDQADPQKGSTDQTAILRRTEAKLRRAEAEVKRLQAELRAAKVKSRVAWGSHEQITSQEYSAISCCQHFFGCLCLYLLLCCQAFRALCFYLASCMRRAVFKKDAADSVSALTPSTREVSVVPRSP
eukprot:TRINITY_DN93054_c0_g1_i1.p1 TRINITY_DN93054_c0_g1~~TRINITY_DN93054_c0_g1_i1.p1  ORF type:complete len:573 (-),score=115.07 TRINITY_DN93054_c0_g1_i1:104-1822(-)